MIKIFYFLLLFLLIACSNGTNKLLLKSNSEFLFPDSGEIDKEYGSLQEFEKQTLIVKYLNDTIHAECSQYVNACGKAIANIIFFGDTIYLTTTEISSTVCASQDWYKYQYWISNPENKKFIFTQK